MEPATTSLSLAKAGAELAQKEAETFLNTLLGEPLKEFGGLLKDKIAARRFRNLTKIVISSKRQLEECGLTPKEVPLKVIHPLLEAGSLEENPELQALWASLLSSAASGREVPFAFLTKVLSEMSTREARFFKALYSQGSEELVAYHSAFEKWEKWERSEEAPYRPTRPTHPFDNFGTREDVQPLFYKATGPANSFQYLMALENLQRLLVIEENQGVLRLTAFGEALGKIVLFDSETK